ncbi:MAG: ABC transporter substrate-binding protein [Lachnospiraceae bacterium]|nr:ABC transporter substrate-binding protein [Lachnospiraceae bacterium]
MRRKIITLTLAVAMSMSLSGGLSAQAEEANMTVFWWGNQVRNERTQEILDMFAQENPGVTFDGQFADGTDYWTRLATLSAGGSIPDVIQMDYLYIEQYAANDLLLDLTPYIEDGTIDVSNVSDTILSTGEIDGKIYGLCNGINSPALMYNKTLLDEAGIEVPDYMTLDQFKDICREVYEKTGYKTSLTLGSSTSTAYLEYLLRSHGLQLYGDGAFGVNGAEDFEEFFELLEIGITEGWHVDPSVYVERQAASVEQDCLVYGSSPETMSWCAFYASNQLVAMQNAAPEGIEIGITTWPTDDPEASNYLKPSQFFCISADTEYPEIAAQLLNYITNSVECNNVLLGERGVPISSVVAESISDNLSEKEQEVVTYINDVITPMCSTINPPSPENASEVISLIDGLTEKVLYQEITPKEAAEQLYEEGNAILAS